MQELRCRSRQSDNVPARIGALLMIAMIAACRRGTISPTAVFSCSAYSLALDGLRT
jgi:hypothetical protein